MSQYPVITAGKVSVADLQAMIDDYVIKASATTRTSTTTVSDDPELVTPTLVANGIYLVEFVIRMAGLAAAGFKTQWSVPSGASGNKDCMGPGSANATEANGNTTELRWAVHGFTTAVAYTDPRNSASLQVPVIERSIVTLGGTAGTITLQWAQNSSNATGTVVAAGSYVRTRRIG